MKTPNFNEALEAFGSFGAWGLELGTWSFLP
jgi:hypothetical protein